MSVTINPVEFKFPTLALPFIFSIFGVVPKLKVKSELPARGYFIEENRH